jgi:hypothetical protein
MWGAALSGMRRNTSPNASDKPLRPRVRDRFAHRVQPSDDGRPGVQHIMGAPFQEAVAILHPTNHRLVAGGAVEMVARDPRPRLNIGPKRSLRV